jgi:hypothetical protein
MVAGRAGAYPRTLPLTGGSMPTVTVQTVVPADWPSALETTVCYLLE